MFVGVTQTQSEDEASGATITHFGLNENQVKITVGKTPGVATVEWEASPAGDVIADAVVALLMHAQSSTASIRLTGKPCRHPRSTEEEEPSSKKRREGEETSTTESRLRLIRDTLRDQFETVEAVFEGNSATYEITTDSGLESGSLGDDGVLVCSAKVSFADSSGNNAEITVECTDSKLASNVQTCLRNLAAAAAPIPL